MFFLQLLVQVLKLHSLQQFGILKTIKNILLDHKFLLPENYFLDSQLLVTLKNQKLLNPLLDSISHAFESLWNKNRNHESIEYSLKSLRLNINTLKKLIHRMLIIIWKICCLLVT